MPDATTTTTFTPVSTTVQLVPQPTDVSCWAASLAMVAGTRDAVSYAPDAIASAAGMTTTDGYGWPDIQNAVTKWSLETIGPACRLPEDWANLIATKGPIWIVETGAPYHAVVVTGLSGDGTPAGTTVTINNPWPPNQGVIETKSFADFDSDFGLGAGADAQMVSA